MSYVITGMIVFLVSELLNGISHIQLRNLRRPGTRDRGIPTGLLFEYVSCPNYTCEITAWVGFSILTCSIASMNMNRENANRISGALFTLVGFGQMLSWAQKKHRRYKKEFPNYPKSRKVLVPFIY